MRWGWARQGLQKLAVLCIAQLSLQGGHRALGKSCRDLEGPRFSKENCWGLCFQYKFAPYFTTFLFFCHISLVLNRHHLIAVTRTDPQDPRAHGSRCYGNSELLSLSSGNLNLLGKIVIMSKAGQGGSFQMSAPANW